MTTYPRDMIGYGAKPPHACWPGNARIALQFVIAYEEGGENNVLHGDRASETFLSEMVGAQAFEDRHMSMESIYEFGTRVGFWRLMREFERRRLHTTVLAIGMALERHPEAAAAMVELGHEISGHGWRWISYQNIDEHTEREHMQRCCEALERLTGQTPIGWYTGRDNPRTRGLVVEHGGFLYDSDSYADELPYWVKVGQKHHLVVPYTLDANDMRFASPQGFNCGDQFFTYLKDSFDVLYAEGEHTPKMMSVGLHLRIIGRPGRFAALQRFLDYVQSHGRVWICRRADIARHWIQHHPAQGTP